tara:strand:+ start:779 stop:2320 length:1542 start_codon:yes stop_codon:yes gene_type:complete
MQSKNLFLQKINNILENGDINLFFHKRLYNVCESNNQDLIKKSIESAIYLSSIGISSFELYKKYLNLKNIARANHISFDSKTMHNIVKKLNSYNINNINDYYSIILEAILNSNDLKKKAYPLYMGALSDDPPNEYSLKRWGGVVNKIYGAVSSGDMTYGNALDYYASLLENDKESDSFKRWMKYYEDGGSSLYAHNEERYISKSAGYPIDLVTGFYSEDNNKDFSFESNADDARKSADLKSRYSMWKKKLNSALRRIDRLLRDSEDYCSPETYEEIAGRLHSLDLKVNQMRLASTAADLTYSAAIGLKKVGLENEANMLYKIAQEAPVQEPPSPEPDADATDEAPQSAEDVLRETEPVSVSDIDPIPGAAPGEYDDLAGETSLDDAAGKLEEVAGMLADRRVIRLLAEFDILLDKLGLATMFPELAESQAKLIDSYGYALTRVTKMLGMLANTGALVQAIENKKRPSDEEEGGGVIADELSPSPNEESPAQGGGETLSQEAAEPEGVAVEPAM